MGQCHKTVQIAVALKPDLANAYYNLGRPTGKGDLNNALAQYETVQRLVAADKPNLDIITKEVETLRQELPEEKLEDQIHQRMMGLE